MSKANTKIDSMLYSCWSEVRSRTARILLVAGIAALVSLPTAALAQSATICGPEVKEEVLKVLASVEDADEAQKSAVQQELYSMYQVCAQDAKFVPSSFYLAAQECGAAVSNLGSLFFEEMSCSGYDPQRRQFASPIRIKQTFGFGGAPLPGSREYVLHCVANAFGVLVPVGRDSVHLANAIANQSPTWQFAVITSATENLQTIYPMDGQTRRARSILSWALPPTSCNYTPIWGNALNYRIRLDQ
jgi:hypothetical protein